MSSMHTTLSPPARFSKAQSISIHRTKLNSSGPLRVVSERTITLNPMFHLQLRSDIPLQHNNLCCGTNIHRNGKQTLACSALLCSVSVRPLPSSMRPEGLTGTLHGLDIMHYSTGWLLPGRYLTNGETETIFPVTPAESAFLSVHNHCLISISGPDMPMNHCLPTCAMAVPRDDNGKSMGFQFFSSARDICRHIVGQIMPPHPHFKLFALRTTHNPASARYSVVISRFKTRAKKAL